MSDIKDIIGFLVGVKQSRPLTVEEMRAKFLDQIRAYVDYWAHPDRANHMGHPYSLHSRFSGLAHSILALLDGCSPCIPPVGLKVFPHESDKDYHKARGEHWWSKSILTDANTQLHDLLYNDANGKIWNQAHDTVLQSIKVAVEQYAIDYGDEARGLFTNINFRDSYSEIQGDTDIYEDPSVVYSLLSNRPDISVEGDKLFRYHP
jgi:hypothetical protein